MSALLVAAAQATDTNTTNTCFDYNEAGASCLALVVLTLCRAQSFLSNLPQVQREILRDRVRFDVWRE